VSAKGFLLAKLYAQDGRGDPNARLIAAAPELAATLRTMTHFLLDLTSQSDAQRLDLIERLHKNGTLIETARELLARIEVAP
jgi:hypothetical protein